MYMMILMCHMYIWIYTYFSSLLYNIYFVICMSINIIIWIIHFVMHICGDAKG